MARRADRVEDVRELALALDAVCFTMHVADPAHPSRKAGSFYIDGTSEQILRVFHAFKAVRSAMKLEAAR